MTATQIKALQTAVGAAPDGFWGPKSIAACQRHLRALMPNPNPWPTTAQTNLQRFYGSPGDTSLYVQIEPPYPMFLYDGTEKVRKITVHRRCAESLLRVLVDIARVFPTDEDRKAAGVTKFFGIYNNRPMRNGTLPSMHARAAAIDINATRNGNTTAWPVRATMPLEVMECFAREGWKSAGAFWGRDAMHFEASR